jgi:hypothetical protein
MRGIGLKNPAVGLRGPAIPVRCGEVIAKRIIETAQRGVKDPNALADDAVQFLTVNYKDDCIAN